MKKRKKKEFLKRRVLSGAIAFTVVFSSLVAPQGAITAYAESGGSPPQDEGGESGSSDSLIKAEVDNSSPYSPTQISNGNFETEPWESFVLNGVTYTAVNTSVSGTIERSIPNGVGEGWNTTEKTPYKGNLFEVWPTDNLLDKQENGRDFTGNGKYFIEMNTNNPACLYQDLATQGGDVIKWTLQHAARNHLGFQEQRMYVTIGAPERKDGNIVAAEGVGVVNNSNNSINDQIKTNIKSEGKAEYRYSNENQVSGNTAYANSGELAGLSVMKTDTTWNDAIGIYVVPDGQDVTRFAFCADATSKKEGDNAKDLSGGNFLDNITFSTLVGNLKATKVSAEESETTGKIKVTGYWGDTDANNHLIVEVGATKNRIDMSAVSNNNFMVEVPDTTTEGNRNIKVYHEKYERAAKTVVVSHMHPWKYEVGIGENANQLSAYCTNDTDTENCVAAGEANKKTLTLQALDAEYTGKPYVGASFENAQKTAWIAAGLDVPKIQYQGTGSTSYEVSSNAPTNVGTYEAMITGDDVTAKAAFTITQKSIAAGGITITMKDSSYPYDGNPKTPVITVKDGYQTLISGEDYDIGGDSTGTEKNLYTVTITGKGNYKGAVDKKWKIQKGTMSEPVLNNYSGVYDGAEHSASVSVATPAGAIVTYCESEDGAYKEDKLSYTDVGEHTIYYKITKENYNEKSGTLTVTITPKSIAADWFTISSDSYKYDGNTKEPAITVKDGDKILVKDTDYTVSGNTTGSSLGEYAVEIIGQGNYTGTVLKTWQIAEGDMSALKKEEYNATYDGEAHSSTVSVDSPVDATITYCETENGTYTTTPPSYTNVGTYLVYFEIEREGYGTQTGTLTVTIRPKSLNAVASSIDPDSYVYDGDVKAPVITVTDGERTLQKDVDYELSGTLTASQVSGEDGYTITIEGKGNYMGSVIKTWTITPKPQHQITLETDSHGTASASVEGAVVTTAESGKEVTLTAAPDSGYQFKQWLVSQGEITIENNKFIMPDADVTIKAEFEATQSESGGGSESGGTGSGESGSSGSGSGESGSSGSGSGESGSSGSGSGGTGSGNGGTGNSGGSGSGSGSSGSNPSTSTPDSSENASENFVIPVKNENTVKVEAEIKSGTAKVSEITTDTIDKVVENADQESKVDTITIDLSGAKQEITGVTLSKKSVETLAKATADGDNGIETATIELSKATVVLDNKTLETLVADAKGILIELVVTDKEQKLLNNVQQTSLNRHEVATTFEAYFTSDGERIHDFKGGKAVVSIDFTPEAGKDTSFYHMVYVPEDGNLFRYKTKYENGKLMFTTTHFSDYAVIYDTNEKNMTGELAEGEEKKDSDTSADADLDKDTGEKNDAKVTMDTTYSRLRLRIPKSTRTTNVLKWTRESGADGYVIYGNKCNTSTQTYKMVQKIVIPNGATTTWTDKKLQKATYYKYYIKAYKLVEGKKVWLAKSKVVHSTTTGGRYGNAKAVKVNKTAVSLAAGKNFSIKAEQVVKDKPIAKHQNIKYESSNSRIASVTGKGVIKAKKKGNCTIYVYAQNGIYKKIKVTVK